MPVEASLPELVGANICRLRKQKGLTQAEFAEKLEIGQNSLSRMEMGIIAPKFSRLQTIADALGCTVITLFRRETQSVDILNEEIEEQLHQLPVEFQNIVMELVKNTVSTLHALHRTSQNGPKME